MACQQDTDFLYLYLLEKVSNETKLTRVFFWSLTFVARLRFDSWTAVAWLLCRVTV